ncbi:MAG: mechanosensitive ion channel [Candidatus Peribacteraceae bacterium]|nr:mechanosensitive ion channel [Candidatus Peribacteraceae bacterium]
MTRLTRSLTLLSLSFVALAIASPAFAQLENRNDYLRLSWRYDLLLKAKTPEAQDPIQKGIDAERAVIKDEMRKELASQIKSTEGTNTSGTDLGPVLEKQRSLVTSLNGSIDAAKADISLLQKEESSYKSGTKPEEGVVTLTKTYPELLAKKAVLEDRLEVLQSFLKQQNDRLNNLKAEQQWKDLGVLIGILTYVAIVLLVFWLERVFRNTLLDRIRNRRVRYVMTKAFTFIVYVSLIFWVVQRIFSEHPGFLNIFALVGAAIVIVSQDILKGFIGWLGLKGTLALGQRVTIDGITGDVVDSGLIYTTLQIARTESMTDLEQVGKLVRIPNERLLSKSFTSFHSTSDYENVEYNITIANNEQWEKAKTLLEQILAKETGSFSELAQRQTHQRMRGFAVHREPPTSRLYMGLTEKRDVQFHVCFPAPIGQRRAVTTQVIQEIFRRFQKEGIDMSPRA